MNGPRREILRFVRLTPSAYPPVYGSEGAAGADLCASDNCSVPAKGKLLVPTGLQIACPTGHYARIAPRSGLASKLFIDVGAGVVDEDYRGEVKVLLFNFSDTDFEVKKGDRIAQLICEKYAHVDIEEATSLEETVRGSGGFGSTGTGAINNGSNGN